MYHTLHCKMCKNNTSHSAVRLLGLFMTLCVIMSAASCHNDTEDDSNLTENLVKSYMQSFCNYDISKMNGSSLLKFPSYDDSDDVNACCKLLASKVSWTIESINVSGNSAIAQVNVTMPNDFDGICKDALNDAMLQIEQDSHRLPAEVINLAIKKFANKADKTSITAEISISKVNNKWYIAKSQDVTEIISEIRTPVAAIYSIIEQ